jgi:beta-glucuronidase
VLYPPANAFRQTLDLSGIWDFRFDAEGVGDREGWGEPGLRDARPIAVPASWNDQLEDGRDYLGVAWYQTCFDLPPGCDPASQQVRLRFGSVNYHATVWLNGRQLAVHVGGHLPFDVDLDGLVVREGNRLVVRVEGELAPDRVPPGRVPVDASQPQRAIPRYPDTAFDFFPFCGIHRSVLVHACAREAIQDVVVRTDIEGENSGVVHVRVDHPSDARVRVSLRGHGIDVSSTTTGAEATLEVPHPALWAPGSPDLYQLTVELERSSGETFDRFTLPIGIRSVRVQGGALLLNGAPVYLTGFGRHEDFPITGRGYLPAAYVKDDALLEWIGANSFRTSHYPYAEQQLDLADRLGFLVIDETPAVGLFFDQSGLAERRKLCQQFTRELVERDRNHPSVIMWSLANEPRSAHPAARDFFRDLYDLAKSLDPTRPVTLVSNQGVEEAAFEVLDVLTLNRYYGWYLFPGQLEAGLEALSAELDAIYARYRKPLILTEFGADTLAGWHAQPPEMFSEEYQAELIARSIEVARSKPFVVGEHVWNMCDFKTSQSIRRVGALNLKGVFTRDRRPKLAAHRLRAIWRADRC